MTRYPQTVSPLRRTPAPGAVRQVETPASYPQTQATTPGAGRFAWLAPMVLWPLARPYLPRPAVRPQGGGTQRADDEAMFAAIVYVLVSGVPWRALPKAFTVSWQNTHRRFTQWSEAGLWDRIRESSRRQHLPGHVRQWADIIGTLAEERLNRTPPAVGRTPQAPRRGEGLKPRIRLHQPGDLTVRLFGPTRTPVEAPGGALRPAR
ncbi:transposase [Streptomyces sp. SID161]|uniref:transposase n=1 Tax=Streptomyces sp. SID161 TaxID=2690251 RepID=UPI00136C5816|nr:transposase [Streptomyces sp. SID161]